MFIDIISLYPVILCFMILFFLVAWRIKDNSIVDIAWGLGVVVVAIVSLFWFSGIYHRKILITMMALAWGVRLALYIMVRKRGQGEDNRYQAFRKKWGKYIVIKSLFYIFLLQGTLQLVLVLPILLVNRSTPSEWHLFDYLGTAFFVVGFIVETMADWQMYRFKKNGSNRGKLLTSGIWYYSRHPNYFGETLLWWGIGFVALSIKSGWIAMLSPLLITYLLLFFSGIPILEKKYMDRRDFQKYKAETSAFVPWFKRKSLTSKN